MSTNLTTVRTILVATDGSPDAAAAARVAADIANRSGAALHLAHTWLPLAASAGAYPVMTTADVAKLYQADAEAVLAGAVGELAALGIPVAATHLRCGPAVGEIVALGRDLQADLLVIGSRGLGSLRRLLLGSVSSGVAHEATCPVLIVRGQEGTWPPRAVVVGDDGTAAVQPALRLAATLGRLYDAPLTLVHACAPLPRDPAAAGGAMIRRTLGLAGAATTATETLREELAQHATTLLQARAIMMQGAGVAHVVPQVVFDDPATAIVAAAEAVAPGVIVVGSRGLGTLARLRLGSVSTKVLHAANGPVLVVPQQALPHTEELPPVYGR